ncbi:AzlC family ABC transporter permease [Marinomonas gallaica]|uniref:AzlC family ABC transporter permease n=1 Tax=Marinomonas gallaica TaxID=1806667 RepID=UPI003A925AD8
MNTAAHSLLSNPWKQGAKDALPLLGGYIPVAVSFGLFSVQAGFGVLETILVSAFIYAGASQFLFVAMVVSGAPVWLVIVMTLLINSRHLVYGPNIAPYLQKDVRWLPLMHLLTDQIFALTLTRMPHMTPSDRLRWYVSAGVIAWLSWILGTALGAIAGDELIERWPLISEVLPFALPALFLVMVLPRCTDRRWTITMVMATTTAMLLKLFGFPNIAIPAAAICGALAYYAIQVRPTDKEERS